MSDLTKAQRLQVARASLFLPALFPLVGPLLLGVGGYGWSPLVYDVPVHFTTGLLLGYMALLASDLALGRVKCNGYIQGGIIALVFGLSFISWALLMCSYLRINKPGLIVMAWLLLCVGTIVCYRQPTWPDPDDME